MEIVNKMVPEKISQEFFNGRCSVLLQPNVEDVQNDDAAQHRTIYTYVDQSDMCSPRMRTEVYETRYTTVPYTTSPPALAEYVLCPAGIPAIRWE